MRRFGIPAVLALMSTGCGVEPAPAPAAPAQLQLPVHLAPVAGGFDAPVGVRSAGDGTGRLFVVEQKGKIRIVKPGTAEASAPPFLELFGDDGTPPPHGLTAGGEQGLLGLAFHPRYAQNRRFYLHYTDAHGDTVVAAYETDADDPDRADPASARVLLRVDQNYSNHNGGDLAFGPDGFLYVSLGDGGAGGDPCNRGQLIATSQLVNADGPGHCSSDASFAGEGANPNSRALLARLLRLDVDRETPAGANGLCAARPDGSAPYAVPADNPHADAGPGGPCAETWAYGLRNPWRIAFDRLTGDLFIGDVGQDRVEEIDFQPAQGGGGRNYGWNACEGDLLYRSGAAPQECPLADSPATPRPILSYPHANGDCSVTAGYRYRGPVAPLRGLYVYGDYCSGRVWFARQQDDGRWIPGAWARVGANISSFGEDEQGNLYLVDYAGGAAGKGNVRRFAATK